MGEEIKDPDLQRMLNRILVNSQANTTGETNQTDYDNSGTVKITPEELDKRGIYKRYHSCSFATIEDRGIPVQVRNDYLKVKDYAENLKRYAAEGTGLILKGPVGTMKTTVAVAVARHYIEQRGGVLFVPMASLLDTIFTMKKKDVEEWVRYEERIRNVGLLILDDLGAEYHQEWVLSKVDSIVTERYNRMKPIIVTTNLSNDELRGKYAERIIDRLRATSIVINFVGKSLRLAAGGK